MNESMTLLLLLLSLPCLGLAAPFAVMALNLLRLAARLLSFALRALAGSSGKPVA